MIGLEYRDAELPFLLDTGKDTASFFESFAQSHPEILSGSVKEKRGNIEMGSKTFELTEIIPQLSLSVTGRRVMLYDTSLEKQPADLPPIYGRMGGSLLVNGYELDFRRMSFSILGGEQASPARPDGTPP